MLFVLFLFYSFFGCLVCLFVAVVFVFVADVVVVVIVVVASVFCTKPHFRFAACFSSITRGYLSLLFTNEKQKDVGK